MADGARPALAADLPAVTTLAREAVAELGALRGGAVWRVREARQEPMDDALGAMIGDADPAVHVIVGTFAATVVGYGVVRLEELADGKLLAVVEDLYVHPEARGVGVGEAMMDLLVAEARAAGAIGIDSLALPGDRATKNFFESCGLKARAILVHKAFDQG